MTAEKSTDWLIDLLYADDDEDALDFEEADLSTDQLDELEDMRSMLSELRGAWPEETPSASVTRAILDAAHETAAAETASQAQAARMPRATRSATGSLWGRMRAQTVAQITGVALVLLTGAFFLGQMPQDQHSEPPSSGEIARAPMPVTNQDDPNDFPTQEQEELAVDREADKLSDAKTLALKPKAPQKKEMEGMPAVAAEPERQPQRQRRVANVPKKKSKRKSSSVRFGDNTLFDADTSTRGSSARPATKQAPKKRAGSEKSSTYSMLSSSSKNSGLFGQEGPTTSVGEKKEITQKKDDAPTDDVIEEARNARGAARNRSTSITNSATESESTDGVQNLGKSAVLTPSAKPAPRPTAEPKPATPSSSGPPVAPQKAQSIPTVSGIERSSRAAQHDKTISQANRYLRDGLGSVAERARVMQLKAEAHAAKGQSAEADRIYAEIERRYPAFAKKNNIRRKKARSKSKPMKRAQELDSF